MSPSRRPDDHLDDDIDDPHSMADPALPVDASDDASKAEWRRWMQPFGRQIRRIREVLGLSQEQVAKLAGVSQGAVSRLEAGKGLATPLLIVLKIQITLSRRLEEVDPATLPNDLQPTIELTDLLLLQLGPDVRLAEDARVEELVRCYRRTPESNRESLLAIVRAIAEALEIESGT